MFLEPNQTHYDLRFTLFGTPVRVHPLFWLVSVLFGWPLLDQPSGFTYLALWVICVFLSILLHEFGHVWAGKLFGTDGYIVLHGLGGLAIGASDLATRWKRVVVYLAGPLIQIVVIWLPLWLWKQSLGDRWWDLPDKARLVAAILMMINLYWPLINLAPVWPLDGGKVAREFCTWLSPRQGLRASLIVSAVAGGILAVNSVAAMKGVHLIPYIPTGGWYFALFFGLLAVESIQLLNQVQPWRYEEPDDRLPWE
jgi:Zn-dependent protease